MIGYHLNSHGVIFDQSRMSFRILDGGQQEKAIIYLRRQRKNAKEKTSKNLNADKNSAVPFISFH